MIIPRELLFAGPSRLAPALAPAGDRIAFVAPLDGVPNLWVQEVGAADARPVTFDTDRGVYWFTWTPDGRRLLYPQDNDGDERGHLFAVDTATGAVSDLTPFDGVQARFLALDGDGLLVGLNLGDPRRHDAYRIDLRSGELTLDALDEGFRGWVAAPGPAAGAALAQLPDGGLDVLVRDGRHGWRPRYHVPPEDAPAFRAIGFGPHGRHLWLLSSKDADTNRLLRLDIATGEVAVVHEDRHYDVDQVSFNPRTREPDLVVVRRARADTHPLTASVSADLAALQAHCRGDIRLLGRDRADRRWLVQDVVDAGPAAFLLYDRESAAIEPLFSHQPDLAGHRLAAVEPFEFRARDGLAVHGYLTFPPAAPRRALPTVVAVHGGPWARDNWGYRAESQWLANRGYLCVQVNYRGSTGYGKDFTNAGDREWGGRIQDDISDAVGHVIGAGFADPERVAVYGASFGGYAALVGATATPWLFRCAIAVAGPSDLRTFVRSMPGYGSVATTRLVARVGHPDHDADFLWSRSPLSRVDSVRIPILLAHGANDPRVPRAESDRFVAALRERGVPHEYLVFPDEGHSLVRPRNRLAFYAAAERFLARHLGGDCEDEVTDRPPDLAGTPG
jgi:dipeptidyl aminopeptidase/acylaminoacyl peptidase